MPKASALPSRFTLSRVIGLVISATALTGALAFYGSQFGTVGVTSQPAASIPLKITALGRLEPAMEVVQLSAPVALDGDRLDQLLVKEGDRVKARQVVAIFDSRDRLQDELRQIQEQVKLTQAKLNQVKAGAKTGEIQAQQATIAQLQAEIIGSIATQTAAIARWQSEVRNARAEYARFQQLYHQGAITSLSFANAASNLDSKRLVAETAQAQLNEAIAMKNRTVASLQAQLSEAKATLNRIAEVRPVDVQAAQIEVEAAIAAVKHAQTALEQAYVRAPITGQILKIHTQPGEKLSDNGIAELAQTDQMIAVAEVYQTDIGKVQIEQQAVITSQAFLGELRGVISQIGLQVNRQNVFSNQPGENLDRRVVEVKISLNSADSKRVAGLTNLQVQTAIQL